MEKEKAEKSTKPEANLSYLDSKSTTAAAAIKNASFDLATVEVVQNIQALANSVNNNSALPANNRTNFTYHQLTELEKVPAPPSSPLN